MSSKQSEHRPCIQPAATFSSSDVVVSDTCEKEQEHNGSITLSCSIVKSANFSFQPLMPVRENAGHSTLVIFF